MGPSRDRAPSARSSVGFSPSAYTQKCDAQLTRRVNEVPVSKPHALPENGGGRWPHTGFRSVQWGDLEVGFTKAPAVD